MMRRAAAMLLLAAAVAAEEGPPIEPLAAEDLGVVQEAVADMRAKIVDAFTTQAEAAMQELGFTEDLMNVLNDTGRLSEMADRATENLEGFMEAIESNPDFLFEEIEPLFASNSMGSVEDLTGFCSADGAASNQKKAERSQAGKASTTDRFAETTGDVFEPWRGGKKKGRLTVSLSYEKRVNRGFAFGGGADFIAEAGAGSEPYVGLAARFGFSAILDPTAPSDTTSRKVKITANLGIHGNNPERPADQFTLSVGFGSAGTNGPFLELTNPKSKARVGFYEVVFKFALPHLGCLFRGGEDTAYFWDHIALSGVGITFASVTVSETKLKDAKAMTIIMSDIGESLYTFSDSPLRNGTRAASVLDSGFVVDCTAQTVEPHCDALSLSCSWTPKNDPNGVCHPKCSRQKNSVDCGTLPLFCEWDGNDCIVIGEPRGACEAMSSSECDASSRCETSSSGDCEKVAPKTCEDFDQASCPSECEVVGGKCTERCGDMSEADCKTSPQCDFLEATSKCVDEGTGPVVCEDRPKTDCEKDTDSCIVNGDKCEEKKECKDLTSSVCDATSYCESVGDDCLEKGADPVPCEDRPKTDCEKDTDSCIVNGDKCEEKKECKDLTSSVCDATSYCESVGDDCFEKGTDPVPCEDRPKTDCEEAGDSCIVNGDKCEEKKECKDLTPSACDTTSYCESVGDDCLEKGTDPVPCEDRPKTDCEKDADSCIVNGDKCEEKKACKDLTPSVCDATSYCESVGDDCFEKGDAPSIPCDERSSQDCTETGDDLCQLLDNVCRPRLPCKDYVKVPCEEDDSCHWTGTVCEDKQVCKLKTTKSPCQALSYCRWVASSTSCRDRKQSWGDYFYEKGARVNIAFAALMTDPELYQTPSCRRTPSPSATPEPADNSTSAPTTPSPPTPSPPTPSPPTPAPATPAPPTEAPPTPAPLTGAPTTKRGAKALSESETPNLDLAVLFAEAMKSGEAKAPFCFGKCEAPLSAVTSVSGDATVTTDSGCNEVKFQATTHLVTLSGLGYAVSGADGGDSFSRILKAINVEGLGVSDAAATLEAGLDGRVLFEVAGTPKFDNTALSFLANTAAGLPVRVSVEHQASYWKLRFAIETKPDTSDNMLRVADINGTTGLSLYMQYTTFQSLGGIPASEYKVSLPLSLCVEGCDAPVGAAERVDLYFTGEMGVTFNPTPQVSGDLMASVWWYSALGLPFLHVGDMLLGLDVDLATLLPTRLAVGGAVCLGKKANCISRTSPYIEARAYLGLSARQKEENYFIGMVTRMTIGDVLDVFAEYASGIDNVKGLLGSGTLGSGIYPWDESKCPANDDATPSTNTSALNLDCFAYVSFSLVDRTLEFSPENKVEIASGIQVRGVLDLFGWQIRSYVRIDERAVVINTSMSDALAVTIGDFDLMKIGHHFDADDNLVGGANFFMKLVAVPAEAAVDINGAFEIALLGAKGSVAVRLDRDVFRFNMEMGLFGGAWKSEVQAEWDWAFTHFLLRLEARSWIFVSLDDLSFQYSKAAQKGEFNLDLTVLAIAKLRTNIAIAIVNDAFHLGFFARASLLGAYIEVEGKGVVPQDISNMEWDLDVEVGFDPLALLKDLSAAVEAAAQFVKEVWNNIAEGVSKAWNAVKDAVGGFIKDVAENVKNFFKAVFDNKFLKNLWENGVLLVAGKVVDFFKGVGDVLKDVFTTSSVRDIRYTTLPETNEVKCHKIKKSWNVKTCGRAFGLICKTKGHHTVYYDRDCMKQRARAIVHANEQQEVAGKKEVTLESSRTTNPGFAAIEAGATPPQPTSLSTFKHVVRREGDAQATATFAAGVRRMADAGAVGARLAAGLSDSAFEAEETMVSAGGHVDVSTPEAFEASIAAMQASLVKEMSDATVSTQGGMSHEAQAVAGVFHYETPVLNAAKGVTIGCANENADYLAHAPTWKHIDSRCTNGSKVVLLSESERYLSPPGGGSYDCGTEFIVLVWQGFDDATLCGASTNTVEQLVTITPPKINFLSTPRDVSLTLKDDTNPLFTGSPRWSVGCDVSTTLTYDDSEIVSNDDFCGQYSFKRYWKVAIDFTDTPYENLTCKAPQARYHVQEITMGVHNSELLISTAFKSDTHLMIACGGDNPESRNLTLKGKCDFEDAFVATPTVCDEVAQGASWIQVQCKSEGLCTVHRPAKIGFGLNTTCNIFSEVMTKLADSYTGAGSLATSYDQSSALWNTATASNPTVALTLEKVSTTWLSSTIHCAGFYTGYADFYYGGEYVRVSGSIEYAGTYWQVLALNAAPAPVLTRISLNDVVPHLVASIGNFAVDKYQAFTEAFAVNCAGCSNPDVFAAVQAHYEAANLEGGVWSGRSLAFDEVVETLQTDSLGAGGSKAWHKYDIMVLEAYEREGSLSFYALDHVVAPLTASASITFLIYNDVTRKLLTVKKLVANTKVGFGLETNCPVLGYVVEPMVAVYEKFLYLNHTYGVEGDEGCGQECVGLTTSNPTIRTTITSLMNSQQEGAGPCEGMYYGFVDFFSYPEGAYRRIVSALKYRGQSFIFETDVEEPPVLTSISLTAYLPRKVNALFGEDEGQFAEGFAVNCPGFNGSASCDHDALLEHVTSFYIGQQATTMTRRGTSALFSDVKAELSKDTTAAGGLPAWTDDQLVVLETHHSANAANLAIDIFDAVDMNGNAAIIATMYDSDARRLIVLMQRQEGSQQISFGVTSPCDAIVNHIAKSLVKLYETNGALETSYTNGDCGHLCQLFLFGHKTPLNPTLRWTLTRFDPTEGASNPCYGEFDMTIDFFSFAEGEAYKRIETTAKFFGPVTSQIDLVLTSPALLSPLTVHTGIDPSAGVFLVDCASPIANSGACSTAEFFVQLAAAFPGFSVADATSDQVMTLLSAEWSGKYTSVLQTYLIDQSSDLALAVLTSAGASSVVIYNTATGVLIKSAGVLTA